jgi:hypothetical protein
LAIAGSQSGTTAGHEIFTYTGSPEGFASDPGSPRLDDEFELGYREEGYIGLELDAVWTARHSETASATDAQR